MLAFSRGRDRAAPLPTHLLRICAGALKCPEQWGIPKLESGQSPTSSRQGVLVCGALRLPHDLICLPLLFPQNSLRDFCGNPERQESAFSPPRRRLKCGDSFRPFGAPSRAVEPALGQETARSMCRFQVRKWSKPHRGFAKKALAHPQTHPKKILRLFLGTPWEEARE